MDPALPTSRWFHPSSNCCLDFHGDPVNSPLKVFSDGNHHMALEEALNSFRSIHRLSSIFYCTTPPKVYLDWIASGSIEIGNLRLSVAPDIIIGPDDILAGLTSDQIVHHTALFARSRGNSYLVRKGNPKKFQGVKDLLREDVRLFLSNPVTESASHKVYRQTLEGEARMAGLPDTTISNLLETGGKVLFGDLIHHREAPQAIADNRADVALVYHHLALRYTRIFPEIFDCLPLPEGEGNISTRYAIGLVRSGDEMSDAAFRHFQGEQTASLYRHHGLEPVRSSISTPE